ncbi:MAG: DUF4369 domain-containing protein [Bacteroidales bacterium]
MKTRLSKLYVIMILLLFTSCSHKGEGYLLEGEIIGEDECLKRGIIYMQIAETKGVIYDSAKLRNGRFKFEGKLESPERMLLFVKDIPYNIPICLENDRYKIVAESASLRDAKISGGESQELFNKLNIKSKKVMERYKLNELLPEFLSSETDSLRKSEINTILTDANLEMSKYNDSLISANPESFFSLLNLFETVNVADFNKVVERLRFFEDRNLFSDNKYFNSIKVIIYKRETLLAGKTAPDFALFNTNKEKLALKELTVKNRQTLLIFWASWNQESINLCKRFYSEYKNGNLKNTAIIAVAINDMEDNWKKVIEKENFDWINLIDNDQKEVMLKYNIKLIPKAFLIDNKNKIVMSDFRFKDFERLVNSNSLE